MRNNAIAKVERALPVKYLKNICSAISIGRSAQKQNESLDFTLEDVVMLIVYPTFSLTSKNCIVDCSDNLLSLEVTFVFMSREKKREKVKKNRLPQFPLSSNRVKHRYL